MYRIKKSIFAFSIILTILIMFIGCENPGADSADDPIIIEFNHVKAYVEVGGGVFPSSLTINSSKVVSEETIISILNSNAPNLYVPSEVVIPVGSNSADVLLTGVIASLSDITLTATCENNSSDVNIVVYDDSLTRSIVSIVPNTLTAEINSTESLQAVLNIPAPTGGAEVLLGTSGGIGSVPANVTVSTGNLSADFNFSASVVESSGEITASLGGSNTSINVDVYNNP